jgi:hypothetical protein
MPKIGTNSPWGVYQSIGRLARTRCSVRAWRGRRKADRWTNSTGSWRRAANVSYGSYRMRTTAIYTYAANGRGSG